MTKTIRVKPVTRSAAVKKIPGALDGVKEAELEAALANCRGLINQIDAGLWVKKLFLNTSSAAELLFYLEFAASAFKKRPHHAHESVSRRSSLNYRCRWGPRAGEPFTVARTSSARLREV
jgi:hypothetical protein